MLKTGFQILDNFITHSQIELINKELDKTNSTKTSGIRNADKKFASIKKLVNSPLLLELAKSYLNNSPSLVRVILFNKTSNNNWLVSWHQDKTIAVSSKFEKDGWHPWSIKDGTHHVQPPLEVLNEMVTFRIHLDDTDERNGCLKLIPYSHQKGILSQEQINEHVKTRVPVICSAKAGTVLVMRPHILHASNKASMPSRRRVLHVEFSSYQLPSGAEWV